VEPDRGRGRRRTGRITEPAPDGVTAAEFEQMKRDIAEEEAEPSRPTSTLTKRLARTREGQGGRGGRDGQGGRAGRAPRSAGNGGGQGAARTPPPSPAPPRTPAPPPTPPDADVDLDQPLGGEDFQHAPDEAEEGGIARTPKPDSSAGKARGRNRRHGRRR
jgi:hypothetical protein